MMKRLLLLLLLSVPCFAQTTGNISASGTTCGTTNACVSQQLSASAAAAGVTISGTWSATLQFEASNDNGATWAAINATPLNSTSAVSSATGNGTWRLNVSGMTNVRVRCSSYSSGTAAVTITFGSGSASAGGGGGGASTFDQLGSGTNTTAAMVVGSGATLAASGTGTIAATSATSAAKWTTARSLAGNSVDGSANVAFANAFIVQGTTDTGLSGAQFLGALGTGLLKNATTTGVLSIAAASDMPATTLAAGTSISLTAPREYYVCTSTCTVTPPVPVAGYEFCVYNDDAVTTVITLAALGSSARYENTARTAYGTAGTGTLVSGGAAKDFVCIIGRDSTHYITPSSNGTWTAN